MLAFGVRLQFPFVLAGIIVEFLLFFAWMADLINVKLPAQCINISIQILGASHIQYLSK